jgi:molybdate transport system substrate-binding protein
MKRILAAGLFLLSYTAHAQTAPLHVFASNGVKAALEALKPSCEGFIGRPLIIIYGASAGLKRQISGGDAFDLAILTPEVTADLTKAGKIAPASAVDLAHTGIGFGIKKGAAKPDISTPDAVKQTLLKAKSISVVKEGASRAAIDKMFEKLGIAAAVASKVKFETGTEKSGESVAQGQSEMEIVPLSEIPLVAGVEILGPLPTDLQSLLHFQISISASSKDKAGAKRAILFLTSEAAEQTFKKNGMTAK